MWTTSRIRKLSSKPFSAMPAEKGYPILGVLPDLMPNSKKMQMYRGDPNYAVMENLKKYGPIYKQRVFNEWWVMLGSPELIKQVIIDEHDKYDRGTRQVMGMFNRMLPTNMFSTNDYELWHKHRKIVQPAFTAKELRKLVPTMSQSVQAFVDSANSNNGKIDIAEQLRKLTLDAIGRAGFGADFGVWNGKPGSVPDNISYLLECMLQSVTKPWTNLNPFFNSNFDRVSKELRGDIMKLIEDRKKQGMLENRVDLMTALLRSQQNEDPNMRLEDNEISDECVLFVGAGHETTATGLSWAFFLLSQHKDVQEKLRAEAQKVLPEDGSKITLDHVKQLEYADHVWKETVRLYPPVGFGPREAKHDVELAGYTIPKGTAVMAMYYAAGRDPEYWPDADQFIPERWDTASPDSCRYLPFSRGPRMCIGLHFATIEAKLALAMFCKNWEFQYVGKELDNVTSPVSERKYPFDGLFVKMQLSIPPMHGCPIQVKKIE